MALDNVIKSLSDTATENEVIGYLLKKPSLFLEPEFPLNLDDFTNQRNKVVFAVLSNMAFQGAETINPVDVDTELRQFPAQYELYNNAGGIESLLSLAMDDGRVVDNAVFNILYQRLKKYSMLRDLERAGFSTHDLYNTDCFDNTEQKVNFESCSLDDFVKNYKTKLNDIEEKYQNKNAERGISIAEGLRELIEEYKITPAVGATLDGDIYNYAVRGARMGKMYITSSPSGMGKTRRMVGQACALALPYLTKDGAIVTKENYYPALFISTEQSVREIQTLVLAYVSNVNEDKITDGCVDCTQAELDRIEKAIKIIELFKDYLMLEQIADPSVGLLKSKMLQYIYKKDVRYIFFDYIFTSSSLMGEFAATRLREDVILLMLSNALKEVATVNDVFVMSGTQVSGDYNKPTFRGMEYIRGSKAIADKVDVGDITIRLLPEEEEAIEEIIKVDGRKPNIVTDIYKNRSGVLTQVKIFSYFDYATCHMENYFLTDLSYIPMELGQGVKFVQKRTNLQTIEELILAKNRMEGKTLCLI